MLYVQVDEPYFNEPGYEVERGTEQGAARSRQYNEATRLLTVQAMLYTLRRPPAGFAALVTRHFQVSAVSVRASCSKMIDAAQNAESAKTGEGHTGGGAGGGGEGESGGDTASCASSTKHSKPEATDGVVFPPSLGFLKALESLVPKLDKAFDSARR